MLGSGNRWSCCEVPSRWLVCQEEIGPVGVGGLSPAGPATQGLGGRAVELERSEVGGGWEIVPLTGAREGEGGWGWLSTLPSAEAYDTVEGGWYAVAVLSAGMGGG